MKVLGCDLWVGLRIQISRHPMHRWPKCSQHWTTPWRSLRETSMSSFPVAWPRPKALSALRYPRAGASWSPIELPACQAETNAWLCDHHPSPKSNKLWICSGKIYLRFVQSIQIGAESLWKWLLTHRLPSQAPGAASGNWNSLLASSSQLTQLSQSDECSPHLGWCRTGPQLRIPLTKIPPWEFTMKRAVCEVTVTATTVAKKSVSSNKEYSSNDACQCQAQGGTSLELVGQSVKRNLQFPNPLQGNETWKRPPPSLHKGDAERSEKIASDPMAMAVTFDIFKRWTVYKIAPCFLIGWEAVPMQWWKRHIRLGQERSVMLDNRQFLHTRHHLRIRLKPAGSKHWLTEDSGNEPESNQQDQWKNCWKIYRDKWPGHQNHLNQSEKRIGANHWREAEVSPKAQLPHPQILRPGIQIGCISCPDAENASKSTTKKIKAARVQSLSHLKRKVIFP